MSSGELLAVLVPAVVGLGLVILQQRWTRRQELARERREAYARYLRAQQALCDIIAALVRSEEPSYLNLLTPKVAQHASIDVETARGVWMESGAAEMHASLIAEDCVSEEIKSFEAVARETTKAIKERQAPPERGEPAVPNDQQVRKDVLAQWEKKRPKLIDAMRAELREELLPSWCRWVRRRWRRKRP